MVRPGIVTPSISVIRKGPCGGLSIAIYPKSLVLSERHAIGPPQKSPFAFGTVLFFVVDNLSKEGGDKGKKVEINGLMCIEMDNKRID